MGANAWRTASDWPLPETEWTKFYLSQWEGLTTDVPLGSEAGASVLEPDVFTQMPLTRTVKVERLRYMTDPLPRDVDVVGPIALTLYAAIDQSDTNWIIVLKDVGPDVSVRTAREGERAVPQNLPERELTRGWLKASYRARPWLRSSPEKSSSTEFRFWAPPIGSKPATESVSTSHQWMCRPVRVR
jgi:predicted acyl esterase